MFITKVESRRQMNFRFKTQKFLAHLNQLSQSQSQKVAHADTVNYLLERVDPAGLEKLRFGLIQRLFRMRSFEPMRFLGRHWLVAIDGTGYLRFRKKHCGKCLVRNTRNGVLYFHPVLEAKLIFENGLCLSLETEFILQEDGKEKQDCERNAFYRLSERLKKSFPQLPICLVLDSLYACNPVMEICEKNKWSYLISFKRGSMPNIFDWCLKMLKIYPKNKSKINLVDGRNQEYQWVNDVEYREEKEGTFNFLTCREMNKKGKKTNFVWLTNLNLTEKNHVKIAKGARLRWYIENQGFNMQKNGGYRLEHAYSVNPQAMINFYLLLQIAHIIAQLMEKGSLLRKSFQKGLGSIRNIAHQLLEDLRCRSFDPDWLNAKIQIRFLDSS